MNTLEKHNIKRPYTIENNDPTIKPLLTWMWDNTWVTKDNNLGSVTGSQGSGKSLLSIYFCDMLDVDRHTGDHLFNPEEQILFRTANIYKKLNSPMRVGESLVIDEAETTLNALNFQREENKDLAIAFSTVRFLRQNLFLTCPSETQLASNVRGLRKFNILMVGKPKDGYATSMFQHTEYSHQADMSSMKAKSVKKTLHRIYIVDDNGDYRLGVLYHIKTPPPNKDLVRVYLRKKIEYMFETYDNIKDKYVFKRPGSVDEFVDNIDKNRDKLLDVHGKVHAIKLQDFFRIPQSTAKAIASYYNNNKKELGTNTKNEVLEEYRKMKKNYKRKNKDDPRYVLDEFSRNKVDELTI